MCVCVCVNRSTRGSDEETTRKRETQEDKTQVDVARAALIDQQKIFTLYPRDENLWSKTGRYQNPQEAYTPSTNRLLLVFERSGLGGLDLRDEPLN